MQPNRRLGLSLQIRQNNRESPALHFEVTASRSQQHTRSVRHTEVRAGLDMESGKLQPYAAGAVQRHSENRCSGVGAHLTSGSVQANLMTWQSQGGVGTELSLERTAGARDLTLRTWNQQGHEAQLVLSHAQCSDSSTPKASPQSKSALRP